MTVMKIGMLAKIQTLKLTNMLDMKRKTQLIYSKNCPQLKSWLRYGHFFLPFFLFCFRYKTNSILMKQNSRKGRIFGLQKIGMKKIPEHVRCRKQTEIEKAKATLLLATLPKSLPCRNKYVPFTITWSQLFCAISIILSTRNRQWLHNCMHLKLPNYRSLTWKNKHYLHHELNS